MYVDSYEIELRSPLGEWESVGHIYPRYVWHVVRPWYLLWLVRRPRIINHALREAMLAAHRAMNAALRSALLGSPVDYRIWRWERRGWKVRRVLAVTRDLEPAS
jgi:hypothetical protein